MNSATQAIQVCLSDHVWLFEIWSVQSLLKPRNCICWPNPGLTPFNCHSFTILHQSVCKEGQGPDLCLNCASEMGDLKNRESTSIVLSCITISAASKKGKKYVWILPTMRIEQQQQCAWSSTTTINYKKKTPNRDQFYLFWPVALFKNYGGLIPVK